MKVGETVWQYNYNSEYLQHWGSLKGRQRKNHKYIKREWKNGRWVYYYPGDLLSDRASRYSGPSNIRTKYTRNLFSSDEHRTITIKEMRNGVATNTSKTLQINRNIGRIRQTVDRIVTRLNMKGPINYGTSMQKSDKTKTVNTVKSNRLTSGLVYNPTETIVEVGLIEQLVDAGKNWYDKKYNKS